jgi:hypothetical protein
MDDEAYKASNLRKEQFKQLAKNPTGNTTVYRMQSGSDDSLGLHWTTDPNVAHHTGLGGAGDDRTVHRAVISPEQTISQGEWKGGNIRSHRTDSQGNFSTGKSQWGLDMEAEVRLRPGTTVRDHAVAPAGVHEWTPTGREPTIEARGHFDYVDLAHHAVQGTPEASRLHSEQGKLPHIQQAMFDTVIEDKTERVLGHIPKMNLLPGDFSQRIDQTMADADQVARAAGHADEWSHNVTPGPEPMLGELRQPPAEKPQTHKRVANQNQFEGMEGF